MPMAKYIDFGFTNDYKIDFLCYDTVNATMTKSKTITENRSVYTLNRLEFINSKCIYSEQDNTQTNKKTFS